MAKKTTTPATPPKLPRLVKPGQPAIFPVERPPEVETKPDIKTGPAVPPQPSPEKRRPKPEAPQAPKEAKQPNEPTEPKEARQPKAPKAPKVANAPTAPKVPRARKSPVRQVTKSPDRHALDILMITPEARPFAKTGGLADVCGALPLALARLGHRVTIVIPNYRGTPTDGSPGQPAQVPFGLHEYPVRFIEQTVSDGVTAVLIDAPALFDRDGLYGDQNGEYGDNAFRFAVLCRGALEFVRLRGRRPSVIHAHDWQAGMVPVYARTVLRDDPVVGGVRTVLTIHNLAFQGSFDAKELAWIGLGPDLYTPGILEFYGRASALKGGVVFSDAITTVSPTYAREILTPDYGFGFDGILRTRQTDLAGILNGIDTATWDPASDRLLPVHFDAATLDRKAALKRTLLEEAGLLVDDKALQRPLIGIVTRLTHQKGCDLFSAAADRLMNLDASWVMLGSGDAWCEDLWRQLAARYPDRVAAQIGFDERLAHLIEAGADMFVMPSWYEPCGLNQMYSLRYGTLPIVRATGGLQDTVVDPEESEAEATGFKFRHYTAAGLLWAVERAIDAFRGDPQRWRAMQQNGMRRDFSWDVSAREYVKVYTGTSETERKRVERA